MNLKIILAALVVIVIGLGVFIFLGGKRADTNESKFVDQSQVESGAIVVRITRDGFEPREFTIKGGDKVAWVNESGTFAWPASDLHPTHALYPEFDPLEPIPDGQAWIFTFDKVGDWKFHDHLKPNRRGMVTVK